MSNAKNKQEKKQREKNAKIKGPSFDTIASTDSKLIVVESEESSKEKKEKKNEKKNEKKKDDVLKVEIKTGQEQLVEDAEKLLKISYPETFEDPSQNWADELLKVDIPPLNSEASIEARINFKEKVEELMYRSIRTICTEGEPEKFSKEDWEQLVSSMIWTALNEDEKIAPHLNDTLRQLMKNSVHKFVSEDKFILEIMEMIAAIRLEQEKENDNKQDSVEEQQPVSKGVFLVTKGKVVPNEVDDNAESGKGEDILNAKPLEEKSNAVKLMKKFMDRKERQARINTKVRTFNSPWISETPPKNFVESSRNALNAFGNLLARY